MGSAQSIPSPSRVSAFFPTSKSFAVGQQLGCGDIRTTTVDDSQRSSLILGVDSHVLPPLGDYAVLSPAAVERNATERRHMLMKIALEEFKLLLPLSFHGDSESLEALKTLKANWKGYNDSIKGFDDSLEDFNEERERSCLRNRAQKQTELHRWTSDGCISSLQELSKRQFQTADLLTYHIGLGLFQLKMSYTADRPAPHLQTISPLDFSSPLWKLRFESNRPLKIGLFGVLPPELLLQILGDVQLVDKTCLALTCSGFYRAMDGYQLWNRKTPGRRDQGKMEVLERMEKLGDRISLSKPLVCSYCLTFHRKALFPLNQYLVHPTKRKCYLAYGQVHLGPNLRFCWSDVQAMANNACRREYAMIWRERSLFAWLGYSRDLRPYTARRFRVSTDIYKANYTIFTRTRWEFPHLAKAARLGVQWYYLNSLLGKFELCPHNRFGRGTKGGWVGRHGLHRCEKTSHGFECMCYDLKHERTARCRFCATDIHHEIRKNSYIITTDKILGSDTDPESREWQSHGLSDERDSYNYTLSRIPDGMALRDGGTIRSTLQSLEDSSARSTFQCPSARELWGDDRRLREVYHDWSIYSISKPVLERLRVCNYLRRVSKNKTSNDAGRSAS